MSTLSGSVKLIVGGLLLLTLAILLAQSPMTHEWGYLR